MAPSEQYWVPPIPPAGIPTSTPDIPPAISTTARRYGKIQDEGAIRQRWIEDPTDRTCQIQRSTLTIADLINARWYIRTNRHNIPFQVSENAFELGYINGAVYNQTLTQNYAQGDLGLAGCENVYDILVGRGLIIAEGMFRTDGPQFSQIARAHLQEVAEPQSLRHFYVCDVVNIETRKFVQEVLYSRAMISLGRRLVELRLSGSITLLSTRVSSVHVLGGARCIWSWRSFLEDCDLGSKLFT
ncbi:unnamed protein product [Penicillium glandicola]